MTTTLADIEDQVGETGVVNQTLIDFVRLLPTNDAATIKQMVEGWVEQMRDAGVEVDEKQVARVISDYEQYGRLMPETIIGAPAREIATLERAE